jgi:hypothetical protein
MICESNFIFRFLKRSNGIIPPKSMSLVLINFIPALTILPCLTYSQTGLEGNLAALQNIRAIETAYAREFIRPTGIPTPFDSQITFVQQVIFKRSFLRIAATKTMKPIMVKQTNLRLIQFKKT